MTRHEPQDRIIGSLLGTAVGDAIGLPYEGMTKRRASKLLGEPDRHRFFFGWGMVSDDTEHSCIVAQALIESGGDIGSFQRSLARRLKFWLVALPAGVGFATLRAILRLCVGYSPNTSGVDSAGNGPAMRAAIMGAALDGSDDVLDHVRVATRITHTDIRAENGAKAVALAAEMSAASHDPIAGKEYVQRLKSVLDEEDEFITLIVQVVDSVSSGQSTEAFAESLGLSGGVTGYVYHCVPVAIHSWLSHPHDFESAITSVVRCGGDADSTAAIVGGIVGASVGREGIPASWLERLAEWPRSVSWMERLAAQLARVQASGLKEKPIRLPASGLVARNLFFLAVVLFHGFRRLAPPY